MQLCGSAFFGLESPEFPHKPQERIKLLGGLAWRNLVVSAAQPCERSLTDRLKVMEGLELVLFYFSFSVWGTILMSDNVAQ
jgi:hypothetical protein